MYLFHVWKYFRSQTKLHFSTQLWNAEVANTVPSGVDAQSALLHLFTPYAALVKYQQLLHPLSWWRREVAVLENNCVLETPSLLRVLRNVLKVESLLEAPQWRHQKWDVTQECLTVQKCRCSALGSPWQLLWAPGVREASQQTVLGESRALTPKKSCLKRQGSTWIKPLPL